MDLPRPLAVGRHNNMLGELLSVEVGIWIQSKHVYFDSEDVGVGNSGVSTGGFFIRYSD